MSDLAEILRELREIEIKLLAQGRTDAAEECAKVARSFAMRRGTIPGSEIVYSNAEQSCGRQLPGRKIQMLLR